MGTGWYWLEFTGSALNVRHSEKYLGVCRGVMSGTFSTRMTCGWAGLAGHTREREPGLSLEEMEGLHIRRVCVRVTANAGKTSDLSSGFAKKMERERIEKRNKTQKQNRKKMTPAGVEPTTSR
jgi:hypothetical protein